MPRYGQRLKQRDPGEPRRPSNRLRVASTRLSDELYQQVELAAERLGISMSRYIALLCERDSLDETGRPRWDPPADLTATDQTELELSA